MSLVLLEVNQTYILNFLWARFGSTMDPEGAQSQSVPTYNGTCVN